MVRRRGTTMACSCPKATLIIYNILLLCFAVALMTIGMMMLLAIEKWDVFINFSLRNSGIILTAVGGTTVIVAILGITGICVVAAILHHIYVFFLILLIGAEVAGFVYAFQQNELIRETITNETSITLYNSGENKNYFDAWDRLQTEFECCGIDGPENWTQIFNKIPPACCGKPKGYGQWIDMTEQCAPTEVSFNNGCKQTLIDYWNSSARIVGAIGIAAMMYKVIGIAITCNQYNVLRDDY